MPEIFRKRRIPPGSTFRVKVSPISEEGRYDASGLYQKPDGKQKEWKHSELTAGVERTLEAPQAEYRGDISVVFDTLTRVKVELEIRKPNGRPHGSDYEEEFAGEGAKLARIYFSLRTKQSGEETQS